MIGKEFNQHKILGQLGSGGMGEVWLAEDSGLGRKVALKLLPPEMAQDPERRMRFEREARAVAQLNHPNIVTIYSVEECDGTHFFTMELVDGCTLDEKIPEGGLPLKRFCDLSVQLADALAAAHKAGITHRDLKPANVMLNAEGRIKVLDFGLAKIDLGSPDDDETQLLSDQKTEVGRVLGTLAYMSPEQAEGKQVTERSDLFAAGILLYRMATGDSPFKGETQISLVSSILKDQPTPMSEIDPRISTHLDGIVAKCLEKEPDQRYADGGELLSALKEYRAEVETGELLKTHMSSTSHELPRVAKSDSSALRWVVVGLIAVALIAGGWWFSQRSGGSETAAVGEVDRSSVAVFYFDNITGDSSLDWLRKGLTNMLVTDLSQSQNLSVVSTDRLHQLLVDLGGDEDAPLTPDRIRRVAKKTGIGTAIIGSYVSAGETLRVDVRLQDATTGELISSQRAEGAGESAVLTMVDELTRAIRKQLIVADLAGDAGDRDLAAVSTESVEAYRYYVEGIQHHENDREEEAAELLQRAIAVDPDFAMALAKLSVAYGNTGDRERGDVYLKRAYEHVDRLSERERYYIEGLYFTQFGEDPVQAMEAYRRAIELFPDHHSARNNLAGLYLNNDRVDEAILHYSHLIDNGMKFAGAYNGLAIAYQRTDQPSEAIDVLRGFTEQFPENSSGYENLARALRLEGRVEEELEVLLRLNELDEAQGLNDLWAAYIHLGRLEEAASTATKLASLPDESTQFLGGAMAAMTEMYRGNSELSLSMFGQVTEGLDVDGDWREFAAMLEALMASRASTTERATRLIDRYDEKYPEGENRDAVAEARIVTLARMQQFDRAERLLEQTVNSRAAERNNTSLVGSILGGRIAFERGDFESAVERLADASENLPTAQEQSIYYADSWYYLGRSLWELGRYQDAVAQFKRLVESHFERTITPIAWVRAHDYIGRYYEQEGDHVRAVEYWQRYLDYWADGDLDRDRVAEIAAAVAK